jgi:hypothetical protein
MMMSSIVSKICLETLDMQIRKIIINLAIGLSLSKDLFYMSWKYGCLVIKNLSKRYLACKFSNFAHFLLRNEEVKEFII